jgi:LmbE family N-acetylglucosaminyl deacetylase
MRRTPITVFAILILLVPMGVLVRAEITPQSSSASAQAPSPIRALLIVAHPDDEYEMAGTIYKITKELGGAVDQVIITDGEAGYRYSFLASRYYGADLTIESTGRAELPRIRRQEAHRAALILGIRHQWFLGERDAKFTLDVHEVLSSWNTRRLSKSLVDRLQKGNYDAVFVLLPSESTHGEHKAATILALEAAQAIPENRRPAIIAADAAQERGETYQPLAGYPVTATTSVKPVFGFDRDVHFGFNNALSYAIVVNWVIAEHKSQGLFQTMVNHDRFEDFWLFNLSGNSALDRIRPSLEDISRDPATAEKGIVPASSNGR